MTKTMTLVMAAAMALAGCAGGGGNNVRPAGPPPATPTASRYNPYNVQLVPTGVMAARQAGFTGAGVKIGDLDSGANPDSPVYGPHDASGRNKVVWFKSYEPGIANPYQQYDAGGHGSKIVQLLAGDPYKGPATCTYPDNCADIYTFTGGAAPDADIYSALICYKDPNGRDLNCHPNPTATKDLIAQGVKVINNEYYDPTDIMRYGTPSAARDNPGVQDAYNAMSPAAQAGVLMVIATGDDMVDGHAAVSNPGRFAALPYLYPELQPYFIDVVGVDVDADGHAIGRYTEDGGSTPCGVAAAWCLAVPGDASLIPVQDYWKVENYATSWSSATATAIAALVWQAFPWMTAPNMSDTLLTTTTPIPGCPARECGWGMINAAKAIFGPAQFAFGDFNANLPTGVASTFANDISGSGGLVLSGPGSLTLSGNDSYTGATRVNAGTLDVRGSISSAVSVATGATLQGIGTVKSDVDNAGTVASFGAAATHGLTITGNLTEHAGSTTTIALGNPLTVGGQATVAGAMQILAPPTDYTVQSTETLLNAKQVSGTFDTLNFATGVFYTGSLNYNASQVNVTLSQNNVVTTAVRIAPLSSAQTLLTAQAVQSALDVSNRWSSQGLTDGHTDWLHDAGRFLAAPTAAAAIASLDSLSGEIHATSRTVEIEQSLATDASLANRQQASSAQAPTGVWMQAIGADGTLARAGYDPASYRASGMLIGLDGSLADDLTVGAAAARTRTWAAMNGLGGNIHARESAGAVYAHWNLGPRDYLAGRVSYAAIDDTVERDILLGAVTSRLVGNHPDHLTMATLEAGHVIRLDQTRLTPYAALTGLQLHQAAFAETGSSMGLTSPAQSQDATLGTLGIRAEHGFATRTGQWSLAGSLACRRVLTGADLGMQASFAGVPGASFTAQGQNLPRNEGLAGLHLTDTVSTRWGWFLDAQWRLGSMGYHQVEANAGIRVTL